MLLDLCDRANAAGQCWPKQKTIAGRVRLTERAVCTALAALQQKNLIRRLPRIKFGKRTSDLITILVAHDKPEAAARSLNRRSRPTRAPVFQRKMVRVIAGTSFSQIPERRSV